MPSAFTIADGQLPSNTGAGYVIQKNSCEGQFGIIILTWIINNHCCINWCLYWQNSLKMFFLNYTSKLDFVSKVVKEEEEAFLRTLDKGLKKIDDIITVINQLR